MKHRNRKLSETSVLPTKAIAITLQNGALVGKMKNTLEELGVPTRAISLDGPDQLKTIPGRLLSATPTIGLVMIHLDGFKDPLEAIETLAEKVPELDVIALAPLLTNGKKSEPDYTNLGASAVFFQKHDGYLRHAANKARQLLRIIDAPSAVTSRASSALTKLPAPHPVPETPVHTFVSKPASVRPLRTTEIPSAPSGTPHHAPTELVIPVFGKPSKSLNPDPIRKENPGSAANQPREITMATHDYKEQFTALKAGMVDDVEKLFADIDALRATVAEMNLPDILTVIDDGFRLRSQAQRHGPKQIGEKGSRDIIYCGKPMTLKIGAAIVAEQLLKANGQIVEKDALINGYSPSTLFSYIGDIRTALETTHGKGAGEHLKSHHGVGYSLDPAVPQ